MLPTQQPNRVLIHKPPRLRLVIAHQVVVQFGLFIIILVLQSKRLMRIPIDAFIFFQTTPGGVFAVLYEIAVDAVAVVVVAHQFLAVEGDGGEAVDVETLVFGNEIVKEQMVQTTSKKIVRSSQKQKLCACVPHTPYVRTEGFVRATACYVRTESFVRTTAC